MKRWFRLAGLLAVTAATAATLAPTAASAAPPTADAPRVEVAPKAPSGYVMFWPHLAATSLVMDVRGRHSANGTQIQLYKHNGTDAQWFKEVPDSTHGGYYLKPYFNTNKCLSVDAFGGPGSLVRLWDCKGQSNQRFHFYYVGGGRYEITPEYDLTLCVAPRGTTTAKHAIEVQRCNGADRHKWDITGAF
jgi:hypothetical protein